MSDYEDRAIMAPQSRVLVVDDDPHARLLMEREVRDMGYEPMAVDSAQRAMDELAHRNYALVITDICMPDVSGVELTRWVKQRCAETQVIVMTGFATVETAAEAVRLGAVDYLLKPFDDLDAVSASVHRAIAAYASNVSSRSRMNSLEVQREWFADLLDRLPFAMVFVDRRARVVLMNRAAQELFDERDGLSLDDCGVLLAHQATDTAAVRKLVHSVASDDGASAPVGGVVALRRPSGRMNLSLAVAPLSQTPELLTGSIVAAVYISDPERRAPTATHLLQRLYGLTAAEAAVAATLMQGHSLQEASKLLGVSVNTVRTHIKRVFGKTGTSRQGELVSLLLSGPALLRLSPLPDSVEKPRSVSIDGSRIGGGPKNAVR